MIETAALYLHQLPSVARVVFLNYFLRVGQLSRPIYYMSCACRRCYSSSVAPVEQMPVSSKFGKKRIHGTVARTLATPSGYHVPFTVTEQQRAKADWLPDAFTLGNLLDELEQLLAQPNHAMFYVDMPQGLPPIPVDLVHEFVEAMSGWRRDYSVPTRQSLRPAAT